MRKQIEEYLDSYLGKDNPNYAILLTGKWGCGKTHFIKKIIEKYSEEEHEEEKKDETIKIKKPLYISLFGHNSTKSIHTELKKQISPLLHSKSVKFLKELFKSTLRTAIKFNFDYDGDGKTDGSVKYNLDPDLLDLFLKRNGKITGKRIIVFDDLERCKIKLEELLGFINSFIEHSSCHVIIIADEEKLPLESKNTYLEFKEKLIRHTFKLGSDPRGVIEDTFNELQLKDDPKIKLIIQGVFNHSKHENLRKLNAGMVEYHRFSSLFKNKYGAHESYNSFYSGLFIHFLITYFEINNNDESHTEEPTLQIDFFEGYDPKFENLLKRNSIPCLTNFISVNLLEKFIKNGVVSKEEVLNKLSGNTFFRPDPKPKDHEIVKRWWKAEDDAEYSKTVEKVINKIENKEINDLDELFFSLDSIQTAFSENLSDKNPEELLDVAKNTAIDIQVKNMELLAAYDFNNLWQIRRPISNPSLVLNKLIEHVEDLVSESKLARHSELLKEYWSSLSSQNVKEIENNLVEQLPKGTYMSVSLFRGMEPEVLAETLFNLKNEIRHFKYFLMNRYGSNTFNREPYEKDLKIIGESYKLLSERGDLGKLQHKHISDLGKKLKEIEKNWGPFIIGHN